ncbi:hypothetical protein CMI37_29895 [Candidatus Pacearchaeota archaeon]|nr:hypothetical protein [Candidatus Pacearchaeota archaeon]|tara:strand:- start:1663 stop:3519 length:1857 start_codon:yes stop_codon:yes gene_type:complete
MKKIGVFVILLLVFSLFPLAIADDNASDNNSAINNSDNDPDTTTSQQDPSKIEKGFECLEEKVESDCSGAGTVSEIALTILATPDNVFDECVDELKNKESGDNFGTIKDTALAVLALNHAGEDTEEAEKWLISQNTTPDDLIWYLEQDSNQATQCKISYNSNDYTINVNDNKKIDSNAGSCLTRAQSNFWLKIAQSCFDEEFQVSCNKNFIATLLYKNQNSPTIYPLSGTASEPAFGTIPLKVRSKCFPSSAGGNTCDYESTAWAALALSEKDYNIEEFIPYIVAMSDSNKRYLPNAFIYMLTNYDDYATNLIQDQNLGNYWEAPASAYNKYYDTALALISLSSSSAEQVVKSKDWLLFSQASNGCWANSIRDTAIVLWALEGRSGRGGGGSGGVTRCSQANFFCIPKTDCPSEDDVGNNYFCSSLSDTCCKTENLKSCSEYGGTTCASDKICTNEKKAIDTDECCVGECTDRPVTVECEEFGYICKDSCSDNQEEVGYDCGALGGFCCRTTPGDEEGAWWIWLLIILIVVVLAAIIWVFRARLKLFLFKFKSKFQKQKSPKGGSPAAPRGPPGFPPRPGFPPIRRQPAPARRPVPRRGPPKKDVLDPIFKKLKDMSK